MSAEFYAEDLGINLPLARRIGKFMELAEKTKAVIDPMPWANHDRARVYFEHWSQNKKAAFCSADKWFYCAEKNEIFCTGINYGQWRTRSLAEVIKLFKGGKGNFSGAKTRAVMGELAEVFYAQKTSWN